MIQGCGATIHDVRFQSTALQALQVKNNKCLHFSIENNVGFVHHTILTQDFDNLRLKLVTRILFIKSDSDSLNR